MTEPKNAPIMIFDLDGTLVDSARDLIPTLNMVLKTQNLAPVSMENARNVIGFGAKAMIKRAYDLNNTTISDDLLDELFDLFLVIYQEHCADHTVFFDGALQLLDRLASEGWILAICTNKLEGLARNVIEGLGETHRFAAICGPDTFGIKKPDPQHILKTIELASGDKSKAIMIGDSAPDAQAANSAGIPVLLADFGYSNVAVEALDNQGIFSHFDEIYQMTHALRDDWHSNK